MSDLIAALQILLKYGDKRYPTHCEHDILRVIYDPREVSQEDIARLEQLGFLVDWEEECFRSYKYGSS